MDQPADYQHLLRHTQDHFPNATIVIVYTEDEIIHIDVDGHRYTFEIGSDDDAYIFGDSMTTFMIPLMDISFDEPGV